MTHACDTADIEHARGISSEEAREAVSPQKKMDEKIIDITKIKQRKFD